MPVFHYQAVDARGRRVQGVMPAPSESGLEEKLQEAGVWLIDAQTQRPKSAGETSRKEPQFGRLAFWGKRHRRALIEFCTLMTFETKVGVPLMEALDVAGQDCDDLNFRRVLQGVKRHLESGLQFYEALEKFPRAFSPNFISMIRAGEMSSQLPETFDDLREYLEWVDQLIADVRQASLYPMIIFTVVSIFVLFLFTFIIPRFMALLDMVNVTPPLLTRLVFGASDLAVSTWWIWVLGLLFLVVGIPLGRRWSRGFALWVDRMKLKLPIFGSLNLMLAVSRFTHNLAILYRNGIPILQSLHLCQGLAGNVVVENAIAEVEESIKGGSTISEALRRHAVFPSVLLRMTVMGETTGNLDAALQNVADYYNQVIPRRIKKLFAVLEPMLMLFLIGIVGAVALAIYLPILSLMGNIK